MSATSQRPTALIPAGLAPSWMRSEARSNDLLYLSDDRGNIYVFSYPAGKLVGTLTAYGFPGYECTDSQGDVFVASAGDSDTGVYEYAHGSAEPIKYFPVPGAYACAVDPTTGNLAIIQQAGGNVYVYPDAQGTPTIYGDSDVLYAFGVTYDNAGNLFISMQQATFDRHYGFVELPRGSSDFENISIQTSDDDFDGLLAWDGKYLAFGSAEDTGKRRIRAETIRRIQVSGLDGTIIGTVRLAQQRVKLAPQFAIYNGIAIDESDGHKSSYFAYFTYPRGKETRKVELRGVSGIIGAALSPASSRARIHRQQ